MADRYSIDGQILTDMADAIRNSRGEQPFTNPYDNHLYTSLTEVYIPISPALKANTNYKLTIAGSYATDGNWQRVSVVARLNDADGKAIITEDTPLYARENIFYFKTDDATVSYIRVTKSSNEYFTGYWTFEECDEDGNLTYFYTPQQMVDAVSASLPTAENLTFLHSNTYMFAYNAWNWFINAFGNNIVVNAQPYEQIGSMFYKSDKLVSIPFEINCAKDDKFDVSSMFNDCFALEELPRINNLVVGGMSSLFSSCYRLRTIPDDWCDSWDWTSTSYNSKAGNQRFTSCYSLRSFPQDLIKYGDNTVTAYYSHPYNGLFGWCHALDSVNNLWVSQATLTATNIFKDFLAYTSRLKSFTFAPYEGTVNWTNQSIPAQMGWGYVLQNHRYNLLNYNSGITTETEVVDDVTYQALKDNPDWWTMNEAYSRYNHDSAVETINSLPTTTGTGCQIIFDGSQGSATDGGAIETLTEEEIAVAAAKGWTVALQ